MSDIVAIQGQTVDLESFDFSSLSRIASALTSSHQVESFAVTFRLWILARAYDVHGRVPLQKILIEGMQYSPSAADAYITVAISLGHEILANALRRAECLNFESWKALAAVKDYELRNQLYSNAVESGVTATEIEASANGVPYDEFVRRKALAKIRKAIQVAIELGVTEQEIRDVIAETGVIPRVIRSRTDA